MSYQNTGTPRFYIDTYQYLKAIGAIESTTTKLCSPNCIGPTGGTAEDMVAVEADRNDQYKTPFGLDPYYRKTVAPSGLTDISNVSYQFQFDGTPRAGGEYVDGRRNYTLHKDHFSKYINYVAVLGHNSGTFCNTQEGGDYTDGLIFTPKVRGDFKNIIGELDSNEVGFTPGSFQNIVGFEEYTGTGSSADWLSFTTNPLLDGFSIGTFDGNLATGLTDTGFPDQDCQYPQYFHLNVGTHTTDFDFTKLQIPSISVGSYYDMPHSPNLSLNFKRTFDGIDTIKTRGGASLTNIRYDGPPNWKSHISLSPWTNYEQWRISNKSLGSEAQRIKRVGRRSWDLSFDMLADSDVMAAYEGINTDTYNVNVDLTAPEATGGGVVSDYGNPLIDDNNLYSRVILRTLGGKLPFIFQPDNTNNATDQFALCQIAKNSFSFRQKGFKLYNFKFTIEEVW